MKRVELCEKGGGCVYAELDPRHLFMAPNCYGGPARCGKYMAAVRFSGTSVYVPAWLAREWVEEALARVAGGAGFVWLGVLVRVSCTGDMCVVDDGSNAVYVPRGRVVGWLEELVTEIAKML